MNPPSDYPRRRRRALTRNLKLASVGTKAAGDLAATRARQVFASAERRSELQNEFELRTTEQVVAELGNMKGALMKIGQMASYLDQGLPAHVREKLAELRSDAPPMGFELVDGQIREELGAEAAAIFEEFDPEPIAAASIGQVHRAITRKGEAVAVKVQYPGVDGLMESDLTSLSVVLKAMGTLFEGLDNEEVAAEMTERLAEELDYELEAENQRLFADYYRDHPTIHVPQVVSELSTKRILTTELAVGASWEEMLDWPQSERNLTAETLYRFAVGSMYRLKAFNGDPHPGNYLFGPGGRMTFLDFGLVKRFSDETLAAFEMLLRLMSVEPDAAKFHEVVLELGLLTSDSNFTDEAVVDYFSHFYETVQARGVRRITPEYASETVRRYFDVSGEHGEIMKKANLPADFVIVQRINLGLYALFGEMGAEADWRCLAEEIWPFVDSTPCTDMGRAEVEWMRSRHPVE